MEENKEEEWEEEAEVERDKSRTRMQSSIAMEQSCFCGTRQLFLYTELGGEEEKEEGEEEEGRSELQCSLSLQCS